MARAVVMGLICVLPGKQNCLWTSTSPSVIAFAAVVHPPRIKHQTPSVKCNE